MPALTVTAPAKINLALSVGPPDAAARGMHPVSTWMVTIDLVDEMHLQRLPAGTLSRYAILWHPDARQRSEIDWSITSDLAVRAHLLLEKHTGDHFPVQMRLEKRIPVGGGLGGGSSDAAAMLRGINALFELDLGIESLESLAAELGSDVPFFVRGGSAVASGLGDQLDRHDSTPEMHAALVMPALQCPTGAVYAAFDELPGAALRHDAVRALAGDGSVAPAPESLFNDLASHAVRIRPDLEDLHAQLCSVAERPACVSGSGSCMFVLCDDAMHAATLAEHIDRSLNVPACAVRAWQEDHDLVINT